MMRTDRVVEEDVPGPWAGCAGKRSGPWPPLRLIAHPEAPLRNFAAFTLKVALRDPSSLNRTGISLGMTLD
jgi:hypothetical protein